MKVDKLDNPKKEERTIDWVQRQIKLIKNNLPLLLLVPTLLGGLWQILSLTAMGVPFIRFFSVTQLIADGLILLFSIPILALFPYVTYRLGKVFIVKIQNLDEKSFLSILVIILIWIISFSVLFYFSFIGLEYSNSIFKEKISVVVQLLILLTALPLISIFDVTDRKLIQSFQSWHSKRKHRYNDRIKNLVASQSKRIGNFVIFLNSIITVLSGATWLVVFCKILFSFGEFYIPHNLVNITRINDIVEKHYDLEPKDFTISYFNDTYIFIEYTNLTKEQVNELDKNHSRIPYNVIMLKTDSLFETE